jgi:hypothetical protein
MAAPARRSGKLWAPSEAMLKATSLAGLEPGTIPSFSIRHVLLKIDLGRLRMDAY